MNSTFKVVFNKARGALMVVNEVTSSVQAKGTKTVVATAVAAMIAGVAGVAQAETSAWKATEASDVTVAAGKTVAVDVTSADEDRDAFNDATWGNEFNTKVKNVVVDGGTLKVIDGNRILNRDNGVLVVNSGKVIIQGKVAGEDTESTASSIDVKDILIKGGEITLGGGESGSKHNYMLGTKSFKMTGGTLTINDGAHIRVNNQMAAGMVLAGGNIVLNGETAATAGKIYINEEQANTAAALHLDGTNVTVTAEKFGEISAPKIAMTAGTVKVEGKATLAVKKGDFNMTGGKVEVANEGKLNIDQKLNVKNATVVNSGVIKTAALTIEEGGRVDTAIHGTKGAHLDTQVITLNGGVFNVTEFLTGKNADGTDSTDVANAKAGYSAITGSDYKDGVLFFDHAVVTLNGGKVAYKGNEKVNVTALGYNPTTIAFTGGTYVLGDMAAYANSVISVAELDDENPLNITADSLTLANSNGSNTISGGSLTVKGKTAVKAGTTVSVTGGTVNLAEVDLAKEVTGESTVAGGKVEVSGGAVTIGTLTVNAGAEASFASEDRPATSSTEAFDGFVKVTTATNEGTLNLGKETVVTTLTNKAGKTTLTNKAEVGALTNKKNAVVAVDGDATITKLTNEASGTVSIATGGKLTINGESTNAGNIGYLDGSTFKPSSGALTIAGDLTNTGIIDVETITIDKGGKLTTSSNFASPLTTYAAYGTLTVNEGGVYNLTALNGKFADGASATTGADALVLPQDKLVLNGGSLTVDGAAPAKVVVANGASIDITSSDYSVGSLNVIGEFDITKGSLTVSEALYTVASGMSVGADGTLNVGFKTIGLDANTEGELTFPTTSLYNAVANEGTVVVSGLDGKKIALGDVEDLRDYVATNSGAGFVDLGKISVTTAATDFNTAEGLKGTLKADTANALAGVRVDEFKNATVGITAANTELEGGSFGAIKLGEGASATVDGVLELNGAEGTNNLVSDKDGKAGDIAIDTGATLITKAANGQIGTIDGASGALTIAEGKLTSAVSSAADAEVTTYHNITVGTLNVADGAALESKGTVTVNTAGAIAGSADVKNLTIGDDDVEIDVTGVANITNLVAADALSGAAVNIGNAESTGALVVDEVKNVAIFADPAWKDGLPASTVAVKTLTSGSVEAGRNSYVAVGTNDINVAKAALAKTGYKLAEEGDLAVQGVAYVAVQSETNAANVTTYETIGGNVMATGNAEHEVTAFTGTAKNEANKTVGMMIIDMNTVDKSAAQTKVFAAEEFQNNGILYLANAVIGDTFQIAADLTGTGKIKTAAGRMIGATESSTVSGQIEVDFNSDVETKFGKLETLDTIMSAFENGAVNGGASSQKFATWLFEEKAINGLTDSEVVEVGEAVAYIGATAGLANVTMDAVSEFNDSVATRTSILAQRGEGVNVWVDVNGGKFEGKKVVDGEVGYSSDLYGAVLGADVTVACGATVGAALTVGTADTDSKGDSVKTSVDTDFVGIGLYANKPIGEVANVAFDLGYIKASNELSVKEFGIGKTDADTDAVTFGVRGELLAKVGAVDVVPHVGLRWTRLSFDQFEAGYVTDIDSMNVFQMPVGVTFKGDVEVSGWNIAPAFDLTFTPTWGDKDVEQKVWVAGSSVKDTLEATRVLDSNVVNATLGVAAQNGAWTFGLDYKLGVGSDDRMNNSFNARVNYAF